MMKMKIIILFFLFIFFSCDTDNQVKSCFKNDPVEELEWIQETIENFLKSMMPDVPDIWMYDFENEKYFTIQWGEKGIIISILHCEGDPYCVNCYLDSICCAEFLKKAKNKELIWDASQTSAGK